jgi:sec-independent protein translocase protein TatA
MHGLPEFVLTPDHPHVQIARAMFSVPELLIMLVIVLVIFGAKKLPQVGDSLGRAIKNFKRASATDDDESVSDPEPAPASAPAKKQVAAKATKQLEEADESKKEEDDEEWEEVVVRRKKKKSTATAAEG